MGARLRAHAGAQALECPWSSSNSVCTLLHASLLLTTLAALQVVAGTNYLFTIRTSRVPEHYVEVKAFTSALMASICD